jgi:hypothetical protein
MASGTTRQQFAGVQWLAGLLPKTEEAKVGQRSWRSARLTLFALGIASAAWPSGPAAAYTIATRAQRDAIVSVVHAKWLSEVPTPCPAAVGGPTVFHVQSARVSSINPDYALATVEDDGCTYTTGYFLSRPTTQSNSWRVVARQLDSAQSCSGFRSVPGPVLVEFSIEGTTGSQGDLALCARATGAPWCDQFGVSYAVNATCAVEEQVSRLYGADCIPSTYRSGALPPCRRSLDGFMCIPSGDVYAVVNCVDGPRRIGLHLAE